MQNNDYPDRSDMRKVQSEFTDASVRGKLGDTDIEPNATHQNDVITVRLFGLKSQPR